MALPNIADQNLPCRACENSTVIGQGIGVGLIAGVALVTAYVMKRCFNAGERIKGFQVHQPTWTVAILSHTALTAIALGNIIFLKVIAEVIGRLVAIAVAIGVAVAYTVIVFKS